LTAAKAVIVDGSGGQWQPWQWWSLSMAVVVNGGGSGWTDDDAMALLTFASSADGGGGNGGGGCQICSSGLCRCHHPFIGVDGSGKDAISATAINCCFHQGCLLLLPSMAAIAAAAQSMVNGGGGLS
jgi:hypothetical protein